MDLAFLLLPLAVAAQAGDSLTLDRALDLAHRNRPRLAEIRAGTAEARARVGLAGVVPNPVLQYKHAEASPVSEANLEQRLDWIFARWPERAAAVAAARGSQADSLRFMAELDREVRITFYQALAATAVQALATGNAFNADSLARLAARRVSAGDISVVEREQFGVESGRLRQMLSRAVEAREIAAAALARAVAFPAARNSAVSGRLDTGLDTDWPARPGTDALPLMIRAFSDSVAERNLARAATIHRFPIPNLILGRKWDEGSPFAQSTNAIVGFSVPVPLWNIGSSQAGVARARAERAAALASETRLEVERLLDEGELRLRHARTRARFARDSLLPRARRLRDNALRLYQAGETGVLPVFEALRAEREVALGYVNDLLAWQVALSDWLALLGVSP